MDDPKRCRLDMELSNFISHPRSYYFSFLHLQFLFYVLTLILRTPIERRFRVLDPGWYGWVRGSWKGQDSSFSDI